MAEVQVLNGSNAEAVSDAAAPALDEIVKETEEEKVQRACRQVEFYFADSNLPYDRFMWSLHTANVDHWVPIKTVASFKRMREFSALGDEWLLNALKTSKELEVDESGTIVRRIHEVQEPKGLSERSIYAGFGTEVPGLQQDLEKYFNNIGRVNAVRMRRNNETKEFKGSVFVEFSDKSTVDRFLNAEPKPSWNGEELLIMTKDAYCEMKIKEKGLTGKAAVNSREHESMSHGLRKGFNAFREMGKKTKKDKKEGKEAERPKPDVYLDFMGSRLKVIEEDGGRVEETEIPYVKNSSLKVSGFEGELAFKDIKEPLKESFEFTFVKYDKGEDWALVGFDRALTEDDIDFVKNAIKEINGKTVSWSSAEESEERDLLIERAQSAARRAITAMSRGRGGARAGRGRGGGRRAPKRQSNKEKSKFTASAEKIVESSDEATGDKRKRAVEPDGGPDVGVRGVTAPPMVQSTSKRAKLDEDGSSPSAAASQ